jgi:uncharacterized membrane protein
LIKSAAKSYENYRQAAVVASLSFSTLICILLFLARALYARGLAHSGLVWNLFLAWFPMVCSLAAYNLQRKPRRGIWIVVVPCMAVWLLFFPNAPYILTDILHLQTLDWVPLWYDLIMLVAFAWTGTFLGLVSLCLIQMVVSRAAGRLAGWICALGALAVSGFGIYLGRFPRWNSWDVLISPAGLLSNVWQGVQDPLAHPRTIVFSALFSLLLTMIYLMLMSLVQFYRPDEA